MKILLVAAIFVLPAIARAEFGSEVVDAQISKLGDLQKGDLVRLARGFAMHREENGSRALFVLRIPDGHGAKACVFTTENVSTDRVVIDKTTEWRLAGKPAWDYDQIQIDLTAKGSDHRIHVSCDDGIGLDDLRKVGVDIPATQQRIVTVERLSYPEEESQPASATQAI